jgi:hypothetical protein
MVYQLLWSVLLAVALFFPVRHLIWVLSVRREEQRLGRPTDETRKAALRRRAGVTAALLCFIFAVIYQGVLMSRLYGA